MKKLLFIPLSVILLIGCSKMPLNTPSVASVERTILFDRSGQMGGTVSYIASNGVVTENVGSAHWTLTKQIAVGTKVTLSGTHCCGQVKCDIYQDGVNVATSWANNSASCSWVVK